MLAVLLKVQGKQLVIIQQYELGAVDYSRVKFNIGRSKHLTLADSLLEDLLQLFETSEELVKLIVGKCLGITRFYCYEVIEACLVIIISRIETLVNFKAVILEHMQHRIDAQISWSQALYLEFE